MLQDALEVLNMFELNGFKAYIVGGSIRNHILGEPFTDIDICTQATPQDMKKIFKDSVIKFQGYGSVILIYKNKKYEITTFREEKDYIDNRRPSHFEYVNKLEIDLKRRDFTINAICLDKDKKIIDYYNGISDLKNKVIRVIGNPNDRFSEDPIRMLRAIRFATVLNFDILKDEYKAIIDNAPRIKLISYERKKEELDKIFLSKNKEKGIKLLIDTGMYEYLELKKLKEINPVDDIIGIWSQLKNNNYKFKKSENKIINTINEIIDNNVDIMNNYSLYNYGLYICRLVADIRKEDLNKLIKIYNNMPLKSFDELDINTSDITSTFNINNKMLSKIYKTIINEILSGNIKNTNREIMDYLKNNMFMIK